MNITVLEKENFKEAYSSLIQGVLLEKRSLKREKGFEIHHIIPRALGGTNDKENLIKLSCFEHIIAHYYKALETNDPKMIFAFSRMIDQRTYKLSDIEKVTLEELKYFAELRKEAKARAGHWKPVSDETRKKQSLAKKKFLLEHPGWTNPTSWKKGQTAWNKGLPMKESSKEKIRIARAKQDMSWRHDWHPSEEVRKRLSEAHKGQVQSEESIQKRREKNKKLARERCSRYIEKKNSGEFLGTWNEYQKYEKTLKGEVKNV